jgi:hypothetical protein
VGVVAAIHRRRVLPLTERRLPLSEMMLGVDLEGSQMSTVPLPADDLHRRVAATVGKAGRRCSYPALDAPRARVHIPGECPLLLPSCVRLPLGSHS